jgi:hypothetical protein
MGLWQLDVVGAIFLADGTQAKIVTGSMTTHYCVFASVMARATGRTASPGGRWQHRAGHRGVCQ